LETLIVSIGIFITLGLFTYIAAKHTASTDSYNGLLAIYVLFLTLAQFFAVKIAAYDLSFIPFLNEFLSLFNISGVELLAPVGVIVFPFTLQITDMANEKFGRKAVYNMIWIAFVCQVIMVVFIIFASYLPFFPFNPDDVDPLAAFTIVPTITLASWISFLISERFDAYIYDKLRIWVAKKTGEANDWWKYLWIRNVFSDILSLGLDTLIFIPLAFFVFPTIQSFFDPNVTPQTLDFVASLIVGQLAVKWFLGIIDTPFMYLTRWIYDRN
jgi:uncharacterized integral membrane protein (TIGR00697 family)